MNLYILLINIVLICTIYFSIFTLTKLFHYIAYLFTNNKNITKSLELYLALSAFFIALYNYLIMTQL